MQQLKEHGIDVPAFVKGFVVVQSRNQADVVAVYTAAPAGGQVASLHTERVPPRGQNDSASARRSDFSNDDMPIGRLSATISRAYLGLKSSEEVQMTNILIIDSAATGAASVSRRLTGGLAEALRRRHPGARIVRRDVGREPVPHLGEATTPAIRGGEATTEAGRQALALSDALIAELQASDLIVIGAPMYNFGMASTLKAWFDHVLRARVTFRYTEAGAEGLVKGKRAIVVETRGGFYSEGPAAAMDSQEPHLRTLLGIIGIDDVAFVRAEKLGFGPEAAEAAIAAATAQLDGLAEAELKLAA